MLVRVIPLAAVAALALAACTGSAPNTTLPATAASAAGQISAPLVRPPRIPLARPAWDRAAPAALRKGVYVAEYYTNTILGFDWATMQQNRPPICSIPAAFVVNVATDTAGNLIDPDGGSRSVTVFRGPKMCGTELGSFADSTGQPSDAATLDAANGTIYVANLQASLQAYGNVSVCTLAGGCTGVLSNKAIAGQLFAVAEDPAGNVYASGYANASGSGASLVWWKNGAGKGGVIGTYRNSSPGGLEVTSTGICSRSTRSPEARAPSGCTRAVRHIAKRTARLRSWASRSSEKSTRGTRSSKPPTSSTARSTCIATRA